MEAHGVDISFIMPVYLFLDRPTAPLSLSEIRVCQDVYQSCMVVRPGCTFTPAGTITQHDILVGVLRARSLLAVTCFLKYHTSAVGPLFRTELRTSVLLDPLSNCSTAQIQQSSSSLLIKNTSIYQQTSGGGATSGIFPAANLSACHAAAISAAARSPAVELPARPPPESPAAAAGW